MKILQEPSVIFAPDNGLKDPGGWTGFVIVAESHIAIHTFPKRGFISADIYTCKNGMDKQTIINYFKATFKLSDIETHFIKRGTRYPFENITNQNEQSKIVSFNKSNVLVALSPKGYGHSYFAKKDLKKGDIVMKGFGKIIDHQTQHYSVQITMDKHFLPNKWTGCYWNHSCKPNCFVRTREDGFPDLIALYDIKKGEEIFYAYYMTEYEWCKEAEENTIKCKCKSENCNGKIFSFTQLTNKQKSSILLQEKVSDYIKSASRK